MEAIDRYLEMPYHIVLVRDEDEEGDVEYVAQVQELKGCISQGETPDDAVRSVHDAMVGWITVALEDGEAIPEPASDSPYSGKFLVRCPKTLHGALALAAEREGVSLNQFVMGALAAAVGWRTEMPDQLETRDIGAVSRLA